MVDNVLKIPEFVLNISNIVLVEINKFGTVFFVNNKAKCIFNNIDINKNLKSFLESKDWFVFEKNIATALYNQHSHHFYWDYKNRFYTVYIYPDNVSIWIGFDDITEKRQLSHLLNSCSQKNIFIEKFSQCGYWELDISQKRFYWSSGMYKIFEIDDNNLNCQRNLIRELILPQDIHLYKKELKNLLKSKSDINGYIRIITKNNKIKKCRFGAGLVYENGEEKIAGVFVDVSDCFINGCEKCTFLSDNFNCMLAKSIHDLRQPISAMNLLIEDVDEYVTEAGKSLLKRLKIACNNLNYIFDETLKFTKNNDVIGTKFDIKEVVEKICDEYFEKIEKKGIKLIVKLKKYEVYQSLFLTEKIVRNLLDNAVKFAKSKIVIRNVKNCFWIIDDGCGISKNEQKQVFEDLFRCNTLSCENNDGAGLGLGIVSYYAWLIGSEIKLKSRKEYYTAFKVCL